MMLVFFTLYHQKRTNLRQGVMSVTYPQYMEDEKVVPLKVLKGLGSISALRALITKSVMYMKQHSRTTPYCLM